MTNCTLCNARINGMGGNAQCLRCTTTPEAYELYLTQPLEGRNFRNQCPDCKRSQRRIGRCEACALKFVQRAQTPNWAESPSNAGQASMPGFNQPSPSATGGEGAVLYNHQFDTKALRDSISFGGPHPHFEWTHPIMSPNRTSTPGRYCACCNTWFPSGDTQILCATCDEYVSNLPNKVADILPRLEDVTRANERLRSLMAEQDGTINRYSKRFGELETQVKNLKELRNSLQRQVDYQRSKQQRFRVKYEELQGDVLRQAGKTNEALRAAASWEQINNMRAERDDAYKAARALRVAGRAIIEELDKRATEIEKHLSSAKHLASNLRGISYGC